MSSNLVEITSPDHFKQVLSEDLNRVSVLDFWASWAKPCEKMNEAVKEMSTKYKEVLFLMVSEAGDVSVRGLTPFAARSKQTSRMRLPSRLISKRFLRF
jgi:thiol-disulfide isomerase/thioredoxin